jgi:hypothetical protein
MSASASTGSSMRGNEGQTLRYPQKMLLTLVPQLCCGTVSPEALLPRVFPRATAGAVEAELKGKSAQAGETLQVFPRSRGIPRNSPPQHGFAV